MAPVSRHRSHVLESEDEESSRQSTPVSTAPYDRKRMRLSLDTSDGMPPPSTIDMETDPSIQDEQKPLIVNGVSKKAKHQPGAIIRVKLTNFVTYTSAEFFPGPCLNMVIGPNGTGKSTLVCAICLGLGWGTQYLGRAKDAAEFVKHGCREATIEIELQRSLRGTNASRSNPIITRTIKREGNKSTYTLNGQPATGKAVVELAKSFDIQIDNLCQFLPQDKVVEFAQMTPIEILQSTQRAAAPAFMLDLHENLKELRKAQKDGNDSKRSDREALANLENRQEMQRTEVERLRERVAVQKRLGFLERCRPVPQFVEARKQSTDAKQKVKDLVADLKRLQNESGPVLKKLEAKRLYVKRVQEQKQAREKAIRNVEREINNMSRAIDDNDTTMKDCDQLQTAERKSQQPKREEISRTRVLIAALRKRKEQPPESFDSRRMNEEIQSRVNRTRAIQDRLDELRNKDSSLKQQIQARYRSFKQLQTDLKTLSTATGRQEDLLKTKSNDSYRAWEWIKENRDKFQKPVYGPPMVECTVKDPSVASGIESLLQQSDFRVITVQCREDFALLQKELNHKQRLHDISLRVCPFDSLDTFKVPLSPEEMQQFGLKSWAIDCLEGPPAVLAMLCMEKFLHQCALTDSDVTQAQHDRLSTNAAIKGYVSKTKSYQFIRRAEFGAAGVHARERYLRKAEIWTNQPIDTGRKRQMEADFREVKGEIHELTSEQPQLGKEQSELETELKAVNGEVESLRSEKDEKQRQLAEFNGLDTKITQAEEKVIKSQEDLDSISVRLAENQRVRDDAMFEKAENVLKYCQAVHDLREAAKALLEVEVAFIEARNDLDVLAQRNEMVLKTIEHKQGEHREATEMATTAGQKARKLMDEVKKIRDEGLELEQKDDEPGLTEVLTELSNMDSPKESDLDDLIKVEEAKLELTDGGDANTIKEFEERAKKIGQLQSKLTKTTAKQEELLHGIREVRDQWEAPLDALVGKISEAFGESFARIGCAGQVSVYKACSEDPADCTEEMGGSENGLDFANWAIHISVKFRENEPLSLLDSHRQSGGERAVSTIFYLMALQSLSRAPFRVVDEINQGMDPRNERMVHGRMVDLAAADEHRGGPSSQYFLITPKLLSGLKYQEGMTVLCIVSGENMPSAAATKTKTADGKWVTESGKKMDFAAFARTARDLKLNRGLGQSSSYDMALGHSFNDVHAHQMKPTSVAV